MPEVTPPLFLNVDSFYGADELGLPFRDFVGEGVLGYPDLRVVQRGAGANMSVDVGAGAAWIVGDTTPTAQPEYRVRSDSTVNQAVGAAHATLPRIDQVVAEVLDATFTGASNLWRLRVVAGTATSGATLANRTGAAALPDTAIRLADILVGAAVSSILTANIRDRRPIGLLGVCSPAIVARDQVYPIPFPGAGITSSTFWTHAANDLEQVHAAIWIPRRIVGATRLRWRYIHGATAMAGTYAFIISDASGRKIVDTGAVAYTGAGSSIQVRAETIAATTFEKGLHYLGFGNDSTAGSFVARGVDNNSSASLNAAAVPGAQLWVSSGGVTFLDQDLTTATDLAADTSFSARPPTPLVAISVG